MDNRVVAIAAVAGDALIVLGRDGKLWKEAAGWQTSGRTALASNVQALILPMYRNYISMSYCLFGDGNAAHLGEDQITMLSGHECAR